MNSTTKKDGSFQFIPGQPSVEQSLSDFLVEKYGAAGDGITNDTTAINLAVAAAIAAGGGTVIFGQGVYIAQGIILDPRVTFQGQGSKLQLETPDKSNTIIRLPASPAAGIPMFILNPGLENVDTFDAGGFFDIEADGRQFSATTLFPTAPTTTVEANKLRCFDFRQSTKITIDTSLTDTGTEIMTTTAPHLLTSGQAIMFDIGSGGALPGGLTGNPTFYYAGVVSETTFKAYDTSANAILNGATGRVNLSTTGSGTCYVSRTVVYLIKYSFERFFIHHFDEGIRGSCLLDKYLASYGALNHNFAAAQAQEHPRFTVCDLKFNYIAVTGRLVDMLFDTLCHINQNKYGVAPYGTNVGGSAYEFNHAGGVYAINNCTFQGAYFKNVVGLTLGGNNTVAAGSLIVSESADSGIFPYSKSIGVRLQGSGNKIDGTYGEGTVATSFGVGAICLDKAGNTGATLDHNQINGPIFNIAAGFAIGAGNSNVATPVFGTGNYGTISQVTVRNITGSLQGQRLIDMRSGNGTCTYWNIENIEIEFLTGGTSPIGAGDGVIEMGYYTECVTRNVRIKKTSGSVQYAIKHFDLGLDASSYFLDNIFNGFAALTMNFATAPALSKFRGNTGFVTENSGNATITAPATSVTVAHGLGLTPLIQNIQVTPQTTLAGVSYFISNVTATTFDINVSIATTSTYSWLATYPKL